MGRVTLAALALLLSAATAHAQAWLPARGEFTLSFVASDSFVDRHDLSGVSDPNSDIDTRSMLADVTWGIHDRLALGVSLPLVSSRFLSTGTPPHPSALDNGSYHTTLTDFRIDLRYNAVNRRNLVITPFASVVTPSHGYQYFAHAAPGRRVNELQLGASIGTTVDKLLPGMFVQARYGYGIQEKFVDISHNRSVAALEGGYFATPDIRVFGMVSGQVTHGGVDLFPTARLVWPTIQWVNHDRIARENFVNVGGGAGWSINDTFDVFGSYMKAVSARNTHVLDHGIQFGVSIRLQKSALERGVLNSSSRGRSLSRCVCQKGLALKR